MNAVERFSLTSTRRWRKPRTNRWENSTWPQISAELNHSELIPDPLLPPEVGGLPETTGPVLAEAEREPHDRWFQGETSYLNIWNPFNKPVTDNQCCQVHGFPAELVYFNTFSAGCSSCPRVEATPITWYLDPGMWILPGKPRQKHAFYPPECKGPSSKCDWGSFD